MANPTTPGYCLRSSDDQTHFSSLSKSSFFRKSHLNRWGVPKLESTLLMWMRSEMRAHIEKVTEIAEQVYLSFNTGLSNHKVELFTVNKQLKAQARNVPLTHEVETSILKTRMHELETRFIKDSHNRHKTSSTDGSKKPIRTRNLREISGLNGDMQQPTGRQISTLCKIDVE